MKSKSNRPERIAEEVRKEISELLYFEIQDPRLSGISITAIKMSPDLSLARVYFTIPGDPERKKQALAGFKSSSGFVRKVISERVNLKFAPQFEFFYDESLELQGKIDELFAQIDQGKNK